MRAQAETKLIDEAAGDVFRRAWWAVALRGLTAIVLGIMMLTAPRPTFSLLVALLGIYVFIDGIFTLVAAFQPRRTGRTGGPTCWKAAEYRRRPAGLLQTRGDRVRAARPDRDPLDRRRAGRDCHRVGVRRALGTPTILLWLGGLASIAFGIVLLALPAVGVLALMWTAGVYALIFGVLLDTEAFRLRRYGSEHRRLEQATRST